MRRAPLAPLVLALVLPAGPARAGDLAASVERLRSEFEAAQTAWVDAERAKALRAFQERAAAAKKDGSGTVAMPAMPMIDASKGPAAEYSPKFLALALGDPKAPDAPDALLLALQTSGGSKGKAGTYAAVLKAVSGPMVANPGLGDLARRLGTYLEPEAADALRAVMSKNPDPRVRAQACRALIASRKEAVEWADRIAAAPALRERLAKQLGKGLVDALVDGADAARTEVANLEGRFARDFAAILPEIGVGRPMPDLVGRDLDGKPSKLSDLKGRVVVLDVWATWCGPCVAMIPHEREMVGRLKGRPFSLVSVSADDEKETLTTFLKTEPMPWTHWWNGGNGGLIDQLDIRYFPTIFVIDRKGVLRHKDLRGDALEKAVEALLAEADAE